MTLAEIYQQAADLIEERGLANGWYRNGDALCAVGAIRMVMFDSPIPPLTELYVSDEGQYVDALIGLAKHLRLTDADLYEAIGGHVAAWSDRSDRDHVAQSLRAAANAMAVTS